MKAYVKPKVEKKSPGPPRIDGQPVPPGCTVTHPSHGIGTLQWTEWRAPNGDWVLPLERVEGEGGYYAIVSQPTGTYRCPLSELALVTEKN